MKFIETRLKGAYLIEPEAIEDERGFFARSFCQKEFKEHGIDFSMRGMHYQAKPYEEAKIVSCLQGAISDVIIDLRPDSPTYCQWVAVDLTQRNYTMLYIPKGFAHGFQTLEDNAVVFYQMSEFYHSVSFGRERKGLTKTIGGRNKE